MNINAIYYYTAAEFKAVNNSEFKALIERYETITFKEIKEMWEARINFYNGTHVKHFGFEVANNLTGFGRSDTCSLCIACKHDCDKCVYGFGLGCINSTLIKSYDRIKKVDTALKLYHAFRNRGKVLREYAINNNILL